MMEVSSNTELACISHCTLVDIFQNWSPVVLIAAEQFPVQKVPLGTSSLCDRTPSLSHLPFTVKYNGIVYFDVWYHPRNSCSHTLVPELAPSFRCPSTSSPPGLPLLGNILQVPNDAAAWVTYRGWSKQYSEYVQYPCLRDFRLMKFVKQIPT